MCSMALIRIGRGLEQCKRFLKRLNPLWTIWMMILVEVCCLKATVVTTACYITTANDLINPNNNIEYKRWKNNP